MASRWVLRAVTWIGRALLAIAFVILVYGGSVLLRTYTAVARVDGAQSGMPVQAAVSIARDERDVPHVRASSAHDLFVAEGYAMGSDRLFQMDLTRRFVDGRLAEMLGSPLVRVDARMRRYGIRELAAQVYAHAAPDERAVLDAFAQGINAAAATQPAPPEYTALFWHFEAWKPEDALAVGFATLLDLDDSPDDVVLRARIRDEMGAAGTDAFYPLTDPRYDVPTDGSSPGTIPPLPALHVAFTTAARSGADDRAPIGSNGWVVGANRTTVGKAVLANDPHLSLSVPPIWYIFEGSAPGIHIAGAALAGTPGVTLGHNEHLAWGVTAGETAAMRVVREARRGGDQLQENGRWIRAHHRHEIVRVRFGATVDVDVLESSRGIVIDDPPGADPNSGPVYLMQWRMTTHPVSPLAPFTHLLTARSAADGVAAMRALPEPALNVLFADDTGRAGYHFAGGVPMDDSWGRWAPAGDDPVPATLAYDKAPHVDASRDALVVTSNNRSNGPGAPRLAPFWPPPYRAFEVRRNLTARTTAGKLSPDAIASGQRDDASPAEHEFATLVLVALHASGADSDGSLQQLVAALRAFDGTLTPESRGATVVVALRRDMLAQLAALHLSPELADAYPASGPGFEVVLRALRERPRGWVPNDDYAAFVAAAMHRVAGRLGSEAPPFGTYAAQPLTHALAAFGFSLWNGPTLPGHGGSFAPAVQWNGHGQSFRAVWIAGDWDAGTFDIDAGESGEPGSHHYADAADGWAHFARTPLPFSDAAVRAATRATLTLTP